jgi:hypothetical protein
MDYGKWLAGLLTADAVLHGHEHNPHEAARTGIDDGATIIRTEIGTLTVGIDVGVRYNVHAKTGTQLWLGPNQADEPRS